MLLYRGIKTFKKYKTFNNTPRTLSETPSEVHRRKNKMLENWFYANANKINKEIRGQDVRRLPKSVVSRFINAYKIKLRRVKRKRQSKKIDHLPAIMQ